MIIVKTLDGRITQQIEDSLLQEYLDLGYIAVTSDEIDMIEENGTTKWKYKTEDVSKYRVLSGGGGLPTGGTTGQVLKKKSETDGDADWEDEATGTGSSSLLDPVTDLTALKSINTTSITTMKTVQVEGVGLYKFEPTSTFYADGLRIIQPTIGNGRWIRQSNKQRNNYKFRPIDYGSAHAYFKSKKNGRLVTGGNGAWNMDADKGIITCDELIGDNKFIKFRINSSNTYPTFYISARGSSVALDAANFKAFYFSISEGTATIYKQVGSTKTVLKNIASGRFCDVVIRKYGTRCSITFFNVIDNYFLGEHTIEDSDLVAFGNICGFSSADNYYTKFSNIEIKTLISTGKNVIIDGDSQTATDALKNGQGTYQLFGLNVKNKNVNSTNFAYGGKRLQNTIDQLSDIIAKKSNLYENIYYVNLGTNDYPSDSAATMLSKLDTIISTLKAAGFKIAVSTVCLYNNASAPPANLATYNQGIRDRKTSGAIDYLFDMYETKWGIIDTSFGGVYRKYTIFDNLHFSPELREIIANGIIETLGIDVLEDIIIDTLEDEFIDSIQIGEYDYERIGNSFDMRYNTSNNITEGSTKLLMKPEEREKLANSTSGTFTTVDGKTITITGGMVTSIV